MRKKRRGFFWTLKPNGGPSGCSWSLCVEEKEKKRNKNKEMRKKERAGGCGSALLTAEDGAELHSLSALTSISQSKPLSLPLLRTTQHIAWAIPFLPLPHTLSSNINLGP